MSERAAEVKGRVAFSERLSMVARLKAAARSPPRPLWPRQRWPTRSKEVRNTQRTHTHTQHSKVYYYYKEEEKDEEKTVDIIQY